MDAMAPRIDAAPIAPDADDAEAIVDAGRDTGDAAVCVTPAWAAEYGQGSPSEATSVSGVVTDAQGGVYLTGLFTSDVDFGGGALHASSGLGASFVAKLDGAGHAVWSHSFAGTGETQALGIAVASDGARVVVTGTFTKSLSIAGDEASTMTAPDEDVFLASFDGATGAPVWSRSFGGPGLDRGLGVAVAADGSIAASGAFAKSIDFGDGAHTTTAGAGYVAKLGADGTTAWSHAYDGITVGSNALAVDAQGAVLFTGFGTHVDLGGGAIADGGGKDAIVAKLDPSGAYVYSASFGGAGDQYGYGAAVTPDGSLVFTGGFEVGISFGSATYTPEGVGPDVFVAAVGADGKVQWGYPGTPGAFGVSVAIAQDGVAFVLEDKQTENGVQPRSGATLRAIGVHGDGAHVPFTLEGNLDSLGERAAVLPTGDIVLGGTFSGSLDVCGAVPFTALTQEIKTYLFDLPAAGVR
jgi:hypothetical protein